MKTHIQSVLVFTEKCKIQNHTQARPSDNRKCLRALTAVEQFKIRSREVQRWGSRFLCCLFYYSSTPTDTLQLLYMADDRVMGTDYLAARFWLELYTEWLNCGTRQSKMYSIVYTGISTQRYREASVYSNEIYIVLIFVKNEMPGSCISSVFVMPNTSDLGKT